jgi:hypothetical protein
LIALRRSGTIAALGRSDLTQFAAGGAMKKPIRLHRVTDAIRSSTGAGASPASAGETRSTRLHCAPSPGDTATRSAPWLSFNATELPSPVSDAAPDFGPKRFLLGANLPWVRYGLDIGASPATPNGGLHADAAGAGLLDAALGRLERDGVEYARVFLFCDGRAGIRFSPDGTPEGLDAAVFSDIDVLLATAERHGIGLILVLFDAGLVAAPSIVDGVGCGGHGDVLDEQPKREALLERVVEPLLRRYGNHPAVEAWDLFDEPECATVGMHCPYPERRGNRWRPRASTIARALRAHFIGAVDAPQPHLVGTEAMRSFLGSTVQAVHQHTGALATVGLASTANLGLVQGLGLDFYQAHWWEPYGDAPLRRAVADFRLDRPLVLGAFTATARTKSVKTVLDTARCAGYGGALLWSVRAVDARGRQDGQLAQWARNHAAHLLRRPARTESPALLVASESPQLVVPLPVSVECPHEVAPSIEDGENDERSTRSPSDDALPGLAAAPG